MKRFLTIWSALFVVASTLVAQTGHEIKVKINGFKEEQLFLGYHLADKQYIQDTVKADANGVFTFSDAEELPGGMYLVVLPPDNNFFQILLSKGEQHFSVETDVDALTKNIKITGSTDNQLFYDYLKYLDDKRPEADKINADLKAAEEKGADTKALKAKLDKINEEVKNHQLSLIEKYPSSMTAAIIKANLNFDMPEFEEKGEALQLKQWRWTQQHYFDNIDMADPRMLRTPFLFQRADNYVNKLVVQHPDTISLAVDRVLELVRPAEETFKFFLIHFLNTYAKSNIIGQDAVYVHIAKKYYATGQAPWTDREQLDKIVDNAKRLEPLLIGKTAPNIKMQKEDSTPISLHDVESPYTVLIFWQPDCGHCKKSMPDLKTFYNNFKSKGVEIFAVCTKTWERDDNGDITIKEVEKCWKFIDEHDIDGWINVADPYVRSRFSTLYDIQSTPQIFILDKNKEILSKRLGAEQLSEVMDKIIEADQKKHAEKLGMDSNK